MLEEEVEADRAVVEPSDGAFIVDAEDDDMRRLPAMLELSNSEGLPRPSDEPLSSIYTHLDVWLWRRKHYIHISKRVKSSIVVKLIGVQVQYGGQFGEVMQWSAADSLEDESCILEVCEW